VWRWQRWLWLAVIPLSIAMPMIVRADSSADITVTAVGYICEAPGGFTLTYISDYEVGIDWVKGVGAENTMIRAAIGRYPTDITDGWLVYYGDGTHTVDTGVNLDETASPTYYRAWSQNVGGVWNEIGYAEDNIEGIGVQLLAFVILAVGLTIGGYALKNMALSYGAGGAWVVMAFYAMGQSAAPNVTEITDIYMALFWIGMGMLLVCMLEPVIYRKAKALAEEVAELSDEEAEAENFNKQRAEMTKMRGMYKSRRVEHRERAERRKLSKFAKTGEVE